jgi:hypothetical protein
MHRLLPIAVATCTAAVAATAVAADFTFEVPVEIENIPSATLAIVSCTVSSARPGDPYPFGGGNVVGRGTASIEISDGRHRDTAVVEVNATGLNPASSARQYACNLTLSGRSVTGATYAASPTNARSVYERASGGHQLDRLVTTVEGVLP